MWSAIYDYIPSLLEKSLEQIFLASLSTTAAILIGVPLGILVTKRPSCKKLVMTIVNGFQTIPSIALMAFLIPFLGIGVKPALVTLALYAILPIVRNTNAGLEGVLPDLIEAAEGIGFTPSQRLWMVELPIALPLVIAGIRTAAVMSVGIATVAAFIGAGGLGDFIFQGISTNNSGLILLGAIPAAFLAGLLDFTFGRLEILFSFSNKARRAPSRVKAGAFAALIILVMSSTIFLGKSNVWQQGRKEKIVVGSKDFTEQYILGELIAGLLERKTELKVIRKFNLGTTDVCHKAMLRKEIDLYPEYTGTGRLVVLKEKEAFSQSPREEFQMIDREYRKKYGIKWLEPIGFNNTQALTVRREFMEKHELRSISDLLLIDDHLVIAAPPEFLSRPDAYNAISEGYGLEFREVRQLAPSLLYPAIEAGRADVIMGFSTDGRMKAYNLQPLEDDKRIFPSYQACILVREEVLERHPEVAAILLKLSGLINENAMRFMNYQVEIEKKSPRDVARSFLQRNNLLAVEK